MNDGLAARELLKAIRFAADRHRHQRRKGEDASPYINHPIAVANILAENGVTDAVTLQAAVLHDTVEDTETTADELTAEFGQEVAEVVLEVTDDKSLPKQERKRLQIERAPGLSPRAKLVRLGDKIDNVRDVTHMPPSQWSLDRRRDYLEWTRLVVEGCRGAHPGLERLYDEALEEGLRKLRLRAEGAGSDLSGGAPSS
jgi:guanosine-3',5'-bis(diphosphate) 3'-pyrophosphohydrolase